MQDKNELTSILAGQGNFKVIGKPQLASAEKKGKDNSAQ